MPVDPASPDRVPVRRALLSVSDKTGIVDLGRALERAGAEILSTGGTARELRAAGIRVTEVADFTGAPEILGGRVKTLHPRVFGGILAIRGDRRHEEELASNGLVPIDLVAVNLYPFERTVARPEVTLDEAIEEIDIGGPSLLRAAAKNHADVAAVVDPADYPSVAREIAAGGTTREARFRLARKVFGHVARYDAAIFDALSRRFGAEPDSSPFPELFLPAFVRERTLRYGENPHQAAAFYRDASGAAAAGSFATFVQLQGKDLSYNNLLDADAARWLVQSLPAPACVVVKHGNPCGAAVRPSCVEALEAAWAGDSTSAFGGVVAFNVPVDGQAAATLAPRFVEVVLAPRFEAAAREAFREKKGVRLLEVGTERSTGPEIRTVDGGIVVQTKDVPGSDDRATWTVTSKAEPTPRDFGDLEFAWTVVAAVKSNAIVVVKDRQLLGVGAGQMSRVDSCRIALEKANAAGHPLSGSVAASDAFFPFPDGLVLLAQGGVRAIVHPGGSIRDAEVVRAADERDVALVATGRRHFRH